MTKRFYKNVAVERSEDGFVLKLDSWILKTPGKQDLLCPDAQTARLVAAEWQAQKDDVLPDTMPCTRLMNVAVEHTPKNRDRLIAEFVKYVGTDLLCYRAKGPSDLVKRQARSWQPVLDWAAQTQGISLAVTQGITSIEQPKSSLQNACAAAAKLSDIDLTLLLHFTASFGSAILALAVMEGFLDINRAYKFSRLDEIFQSEKWGEDREAIDKAVRLGEDLQALGRLIAKRQE